MKIRTLTIPKIPLIIRVVSLYVVLGFVGAWAVPNTPVRAIDQQEYTGAVQELHKNVPEQIIISGEPIGMQIPSLGIDLPVENGIFIESNQTWKVTTGKVHYATMTGLPSTTIGNTLLYGHNNKKTLGATKQIATGDQLIIRTANGHVFTYKYVGDETVAPDNTTVLSKNADVPSLTLLTCSGMLSEQRRLMQFVLVGAAV